MNFRHEFLAALHERLRPRGYVEVGVQTGASLQLADCPALGIDPQITLRYALPPSTHLAQFESDDFFAMPRGKQLAMGLPQPLDLVFIDGLHLHEQALRDFANVERWSNPRTVVVFDDVLPRNQEEAGRTPLPGDWTGDVWKVPLELAARRGELGMALVDTQPTGLLLVWGLNPENCGDWAKPFREPPERHALAQPVPEHVLTREFAVSPEEALKAVRP